MAGGNRCCRPTFEKVADMLSSYYKQLHKLQDFSESTIGTRKQDESEGALLSALAPSPTT